MLFTKYDNKVTKITKNDLIKSIKDTDVLDISVMEPVDKSNVRIAKQELDKLTRNNGEVSIVIMKEM
jgi:hypothetical protein